MRSTAGTRYAIVSVWAFLVVRLVYNTKPRRDTLTNGGYLDGNIWSLSLYLVSIYMNAERMSHFRPQRCYFRTPPAFNFQHLVRRIYYTKPCRDTLTNVRIWTEMYGALVYKYE